MLCLPQEIRNHLIRNIKSGALDLEKLASLPSSEERRIVLEKFVGKDASESMTTLFEKKLIMKNQQDGLISFIKEATGVKEPIKKDLISKIEKLGNVLTPEEESKFYENLVSEKLGARTSFEDAKVISELAKTFEKARTKGFVEGDTTYGAAEVALNNFMNDLKLKTEKVSLGETWNEFKTNPFGVAGKGVSELAGFAKGVKASLDDSAIFRQGWKTLFTQPDIWAKNALKSFSDIKGGLQGKNVKDAILAEIYSRKNSINGIFKRLGIDIGNLEEAFPTTLPEKIPIFKRLYKASEVAYSGFLFRTRADIADRMIQMAESQGLDLNIDLQSKSIGKLINSMTGRGDLGGLEKVGKTINTVFFSPKMLKSQIDFFTMPLGYDVANGQLSDFARKEAGKNILKVSSGIAAILGVAYALDPKSVEFDPRSADFGKIRVGNTRFDVSGGITPIAVLATRMMLQSSKSSTSGKITKINEKNADGTAKFGVKTGGDVMFDFMENKYAPLASVLKQIRDKQTFEGKKPTVGSITNDLVTPLIVDNLYSSSQDAKHANLLLIELAEAFGIATNTYGSKTKLK